MRIFTILLPDIGKTFCFWSLIPSRFNCRENVILTKNPLHDLITKWLILQTYPDQEPRFASSFTWILMMKYSDLRSPPSLWDPVPKEYLIFLALLIYLFYLSHVHRSHHHNLSSSSYLMQLFAEQRWLDWYRRNNQRKVNHLPFFHLGER